MVRTLPPFVFFWTLELRTQGSLTIAKPPELFHRQHGICIALRTPDPMEGQYLTPMLLCVSPRSLYTEAFWQAFRRHAGSITTTIASDSSARASRWGSRGFFPIAIRWVTWA